MDWHKLLLPIRYGDETPREHNSNANRSIFEQDYDRVIFSLPFRKLQDKTQVIPLPENDFVHNRLTHSLEVSSVARTLGKSVGLALIKKYPNLHNNLNISYNDIGAIVATAALAHDIGNPPFGHSGEKAISDFFINGEGYYFKQFLTDVEFADLCNFEGNANGFKILTNDTDSNIGGLRLSYPVLASFTKYPKPNLPKINLKGVSNKKYGFFASEIEIYNDIAQKLAIEPKKESNCYFRHPLAFLVEAADDICYSIIDFEDGIRLGYINFEYAEKLLKEIAGEKFFEKTYIGLKYIYQKAAYLRAVAISSLTEELSNIFMELEPNILECSFDESLIKQSRHYKIIEEIKSISYCNMYCNIQVLELETAGFKVLGSLLNNFTDVVKYKHEITFGSNTKNYRIEKIAQLIPDSFLNKSGNMYNQLLSVVQYVAGLSDRNAINLYKKINGLSFTN